MYQSFTRHESLQDKQLFRERLSAKAYAPILNGFMGNAILLLLNPSSRCVNAIGGDNMCRYIHKFVDDSFSCGLKHCEIRSDSCTQPLPINPFGIVALYSK